MIGLDPDILLYATDRTSPNHARSADWLTDAFAGSRRIGMPWHTIGAFLRLSTNPRITTQPLDPADAWALMTRWLDSPHCWVQAAGERTARILGDLVLALGVRGNLMTDAQLAALAIEHGVPVVSADTDFARFPGLRWVNPVSSGRAVIVTDTRSAVIRRVRCDPRTA